MTEDDVVELIAKAEGLWAVQLTDDQKKLWAKMLSRLPNRRVVVEALEHLATTRATIPKLSQVLEEAGRRMPRVTQVGKRGAIAMDKVGPGYIIHLREANPQCAKMSDAELICRQARVRWARLVRPRDRRDPQLENTRFLIWREAIGLLMLAGYEFSEALERMVDAVVADDPVGYQKVIDWLKDNEPPKAPPILDHEGDPL